MNANDLIAYFEQLINTFGLEDRIARLSRLRATGDSSGPADPRIPRGGDVVAMGLCPAPAIRHARPHVHFRAGYGRVIDGSVGGNSARWLNHSCKPNCEAIEDERGRVFIETLRDVMPGDELSIAYGLTIDDAITPELIADYACRCGTKRCTGSMLAPASGS